MSLTVAAIEKMKPGNSRREMPDDRPRGLYLVVQPSGKKGWAVRSRLHGKPIKVTIGPYPAWDLQTARDEAGRILQAIDRGEDPRREKAKKKQEAKRQSLDTVEAVVKEWLQRDQAENRTVAAVARIMAKHVLPAWRKRSIHDIGRRDVIELIDSIADAGAPVQARRVHAYVHRLMRWAVMRGIIASNSAVDIAKPGREIKRDRVLSDAEIARIWHAAGRLGYPFGPFYRLLMLTGARRDEIGSLRWRELAEDAIRIAGSRTKNGEPHEIPLAPKAKAILDELPRITGAGAQRPEYCFTTTGKTPISGWSKAKTRLDEVAAKIDATGEPLDAAAPLPDWRVHDIRRTVATNLQRLGVRLEVTEAILGHIAGSRAGVVGIYQRYDWETEKRAALEAWARRLESLLEPQSGAEIVEMAKARA